MMLVLFPGTMQLGGVGGDGGCGEGGGGGGGGSLLLLFFLSLVLPFVLPKFRLIKNMQSPSWCTESGLVGMATI